MKTKAQKLELIRKYNQIINFGLALPEPVYDKEELFNIATFKVMVQQLFFDDDDIIDSAINLGNNITKY